MIDKQVAYAGGLKVWESSSDTNIEKEAVFEVWKIFIARASDIARAGSVIKIHNVEMPRKTKSTMREETASKNYDWSTHAEWTFLLTTTHS